MINIFLLTHEREVEKKTNTGRLVLSCLGAAAKRILWRRTAPDDDLLAMIETDQIALLYPGEEGESPGRVEDYERFLVLDSTWQESKKIINKSPYLKNISTVHVAANQSSSFKRRRNQIAGGLCTAEVVIELLRLKGETVSAETLDSCFQHFNEL